MTDYLQDLQAIISEQARLIGKMAALAFIADVRLAHCGTDYQRSINEARERLADLDALVEAQTSGVA